MFVVGIHNIDHIVVFLFASSSLWRVNMDKRLSWQFKKLCFILYSKKVLDSECEVPPLTVWYRQA